MKLKLTAIVMTLLLAPFAIQALTSTQLPGEENGIDEAPSSVAPPEAGPLPTLSPEPQQAPLAPVEQGSFHHSPPEGAFSGVTLTLDVFSPRPIQGGGAMARRVGEAAFQAFPFSALPDNYYTIDLPAGFVSAPGIEYYLYLGDGDKAESRKLAWGTPIEPVKVRVEGGVNTGRDLERYRYGHELRGYGESYRFPAGGMKSEARVTEYETEYIHRFFGPVYAVHYGQGLYQSSVLKFLSSTATPYEQQPGFFYSFLQVDLSLPDSRLALSLKGMGGALLRQTGGGYEARVRYGDELGMNVSIGARGIQSLGNAATLNMRVRPLTWLCLGLGGEIGNMPDASTLGFREYADLEFQLGSQLKVMVRGGAAAYNIQQTDGDFGGGITYAF